MRKTGQFKPCVVCGKKVYRAAWQDRARPTVFCSRQCYEAWWKVALPGREATSGKQHRNWNGGNITKICVTCNLPFEVVKSQDWRKFCSRKCYAVTRTGANNNQWKGGISSERDVAKASREYAEWRLMVYRRDHFMCVLCLKHCDKPHAHHLKRFSDFPELRYDVNNGATLCEPCHKQTCKLEELFENLIRSRILRDFSSDTRVPMDIVKIKAELHGDMQRLAEMTSPAV